MNKLSFVEIDVDNPIRQVRTWQPKRTNDYAQDCALGREMFNETLERMKQTGNVYILSRIIEGQVDAGVFDGVEIGFHQALTEKLLRN